MKNSERPLYALLGDSLDDEHEVAVVRGAIAAAREAGATLVCISGGEVQHVDPNGAARNFVFDLARSEGVHGILALTSAIGNYIGPQQLQEWFGRFSPLPVCCAGVEIPSYPSVCIDNAGGVRGAVEHLIQVHGKRHIGFIRGPVASTEAESRFEAYRQALQSSGTNFEPRWVVEGDYSQSSGARAVQVLLDEHRLNILSLEGLVAANDMMALGALEELHRRGVQVPEQIALIGFDDVDSARVARPTLTTVRQPSESIGREAFRQLVAAVKGEPIEVSRKLPTEFVVRRSCGCVDTSLSVALRVQAPLLGLSVEAAFLRQRQVIAAELARAAKGRFGSAGSGWENRWLDALLAELRGNEPGGFARKLQQSMQAIVRGGGNPAPAQEILAVLRCHALPCVASDANARALLEDILHDAQVATGVLVAETLALTVRDAAARFRSFARGVQTRMFGDMAELSRFAAKHLPACGVDACVVARLPAPGNLSQKVEILFGFGLGEPCAPNQLYATQSLISHELLSNTGHARFVLPLNVQQEELGIAVLSTTSLDGNFLEDLRDLFGTVIKVVNYSNPPD